ncbi:hypothetical protein [Isoptericola sp. NPDC060257]|uniref:hypothetical protein n=1 Tax=Isoptericola sp. NPDC060257 TaxID=3347087 RepID=UPI003658988B
MTYTDEQIEQAVNGSRDALARRLRALAKRAFGFDLQSIEAMHEALDQFRDGQRGRLEHGPETLAAEVEKWKALARKWEYRAKENHERVLALELELRQVRRAEAE